MNEVRKELEYRDYILDGAKKDKEKQDYFCT